MIILALLAAAAVVLYVTFFRRHKRFPNEPPLDMGLIPWMGHALEFGKDAAAFLSKMKKKHGDVYTVRVAGRYITILLDPHSYDAVVWDSSNKLNFNEYAKILMERMFSVKLPDFDPAAEKAAMRAHLQNQSLQSLTQTMFCNLKNILLCDPAKSGSAWKEEGLFHLSYSVMAGAGFLTLFGNDSAQSRDPTLQAQDRELSSEVYESFHRLDGLLMKAARAMLSTEEQKEIDRSRRHLWDLLTIKKLSSKSYRSSWLETFQKHLEQLGVGDDMQARAMVFQLWATQGNAGPAAFWLLLFLLKHPEALAAVRGEMERIFSSKGKEMDEKEATSQNVLDSAYIFDSVLNETLRLTAAPFITREVLEDMPLRMADGREYSLRKGDRLCLFPYVSPQMDEEVYEEPERFQYDRYLNSDGSERTDFFKGGKKLKQYTMPWGAGSNVCIGRHHAINSIKQFVFLLLTYFDVELKDAEEKIPDFDKSRYGFGLVQPINDITIRYKLKTVY